MVIEAPTIDVFDQHKRSATVGTVLDCAHGVATALTGRFRGMHVTLEEEKRTGEGRWNSIRSPKN